ncbi:hypothetical protein BTVI_15408 [Pitangus sulphuratus]|nr:hypothetical protein BTVI_15408 [Pitangus sulphuratus]
MNPIRIILLFLYRDDVGIMMKGTQKLQVSDEHKELRVLDKFNSLLQPKPQVPGGQTATQIFFQSTKFSEATVYRLNNMAGLHGPLNYLLELSYCKHYLDHEGAKHPKFRILVIKLGDWMLLPDYSGLELKEGWFRLDIRKKFLTVRVMRPWNRLPREAGDAPPLEGFKARLNEALSNLG